MTAVFITVFNVSVMAAFTTLAVLLLRELFKRRAPRWVCCLLWAVVGARLLLPKSPVSRISLIPSAQTLPSDITTSARPSIKSGFATLNNAVSGALEQTVQASPVGYNPIEKALGIMSAVWLAGFCVLLLWGIISYLRLYILTRPSVRLFENVYIQDEIDTPFVLGVFRPKIYLPSDRGEEGLSFVLAHERAHIKRGDHITRLLAFFLASVHWFNPFIWIGYILFCKDTEVACDQRVIGRLDEGERRAYTEALLSYGGGLPRGAVCTVAFCEARVGARVKAILNYKKPALWIIIGAVAVIIATVICFLTVPALNGSGLPPDREILYENGYYRTLPYREDSLYTPSYAIEFLGEDECLVHKYTTTYEAAYSLEGDVLALRYKSHDRTECFIVGEDKLVYTNEGSSMHYATGLSDGTVLYLNVRSPSEGSYLYYDGDDTEHAWVWGFHLSLRKGQFSYMSSLASSYIGYGSYEVRDGVLVFTEEIYQKGTFNCYFVIGRDKLIYIDALSDDPRFGAPDGAEFKLFNIDVVVNE